MPKAQPPGSSGARSEAASLADAVAELSQLDAVSLRRRWRALIGGVIPPDLGRPLILRMLAYKLQAQHLGDLDRASLRELANFTDNNKRRVDPGVCAGQDPCPIQKPRKAPGVSGLVQASAPRAVRPGTVLTREHGGVLHRVTVLGGGVSWNGKTYDSLSKVALAITGTKWNGPRFFGLRDIPKVAQGNRCNPPAPAPQTVVGRGRAALRQPVIVP